MMMNEKCLDNFVIVGDAHWVYEPEIEGPTYGGKQSSFLIDRNLLQKSNKRQRIFLMLMRK